MNEKWCKAWADGLDANEPTEPDKSYARMMLAAEWALEQYKLREKETNELLARNGQLVADAKHAAATINRLQIEIQKLEEDRDGYKREVAAYRKHLDDDEINYILTEAGY